MQFEDARDAEDAIRGRDGYNFDGHRIRVRILVSYNNFNIHGLNIVTET